MQTTAPIAEWYAIASDSTGQYLVAVQGNSNNSTSGNIYTTVSG